MLEEALRHLDDAASCPLVPGELAPWSRDVLHSLEAVEAARTRDQRRQSDLFSQIEAADPALRHRVDHLRHTRDELVRASASLRASLIRLNVDSKRPDFDELRVKAEEVRTGLLDYVGRFRVFLRESTTWFIESQYRDRGVAD